MTKEEIVTEVRAVARKLVQQHGLRPSVAHKMAVRAALRVHGRSAGMGISEVKSELVQSTVQSVGPKIQQTLVQNVIPTKPVAIADTPPGTPAILANVAAAGDDPSVAAARNIVSKWSFLIPIGGLLMSAKNKISAMRSPISASMVGAGRRR
jgi:hypothetical protein